ncbi:MAG: DUF5985 family protein [Sporichthyaceae bacterium]
MSDSLQGATMLAGLAVALFFLRYWRSTGERLFGVFALAFAIFGCSRIALFAIGSDSEARTWVYGLRALTFLMIIAAILDKNFGASAKKAAQRS